MIAFIECCRNVYGILSIIFSCTPPDFVSHCTTPSPGSYCVALLELQELGRAFVFGNIVVISNNAFAICSALEEISWRRYPFMDCLTSLEHCPTAAANFSIGLVLPG